MAATSSGGSTAGTPLRDDDAGNKLEIIIHNLISIGEWEAVRGHLYQLVKKNLTRQRAKDILKALILNSKGFWNESPSIPSADHLAWLAFQTYSELFSEDLSEIPSALEEQIKLRLLLFATRACDGHTSQITDWLIGYHNSHVISKAHSFIPLHTFHSTILSFLRSVLLTHPSLGHALLTVLTVQDSSHYLANNQMLQLLYLDCVDILWCKLEKLKDDRQQEMENTADDIHIMLSLVDPQPDMGEVFKRFDKLLVKLIESQFFVNNKLLFSFQSIYSCLIGRSSPILVQRFQDIEEYMKGSSNIGGGEGEDDVERGVVTSEQQWRDEFYKVLRGRQHFLERIMDIGLKLICCGQLDELSDLLQDPTFSPLKPLLLLLGWDRYPDIGSGQNLLDILWPHSQTAEPLLFSGCCKLSFQVGLVQWCLNKTRPFLPVSSTPPTSAGDMFQGLKNHSILYVLHHSTPISSLDPLEVIHILKLRPGLSISSLTPPTPFNTPSTPSTEDDFPPKSSLTAPPTLLPEQERDITTFRSFCCLRFIMEAIWLSVLQAHGIQPQGLGNDDELTTIDISKDTTKKNTGHTNIVRKLELGTGLMEDLNDKDISVLPSADQFYAQEVTARLEQARGHLSLLYPLHFRLEMLENIFSLLFLTSDDIKKPDETQIQADPVDNILSSNSRSSGAENETLSSINSVAFIRKQQGFLVDKRIARDLLILLNDSMFELTAAKFALLSSPSKTKGEKGGSLPPVAAIVSSISPANLQQRAAKLQKQINEAKWRLELVSSKSVMSPDEIRVKNECRVGISSDEDSVSDISEHDEETNEKTLGSEIKSQSQHKTRSKDLQRSLENKVSSHSPTFKPSRPSSLGVRPPSGGESGKREQPRVFTPSTDELYLSSGHCADVEDRSPLPLSKKKKLKYRTGSGSKSGKSKSPSLHKGSGIVYQMLASPNSLLCKCLKHRDYHKAREVLKMFNMEDGLEEALVQFSEQFHLVSRDLVSQSKNSTPRPSPSSLTPDKTVDVGGGAMALQAAILNATNLPALESLHRLLAPATIPKMLFAGNETLDHTSLEMPLLSLLSDSVPSLVMLDLLISNKIDGPTAKKIVNMAVERSSVALETLSPKLGDNHLGGRRSFQERHGSNSQEKPLQGPLCVLHTLSEVSGYFILSSPMASPLPLSQSPPTHVISSPHMLLTKFLLPLRIDVIQNWKEFIDTYLEKRDLVEGVVKQGSTHIDTLELLSQQPLSDDVVHNVSVFDELLDAMKLNPTVGGAGGKVEVIHYLYYLNAYLRKFVQLLRNSLGTATSEVYSLHMLSVLHESPTALIGRLVFEKAISPQRLEQFMSDLPHLKIVEVIVKCCSPVVPSFLPIQEADPSFTGTIYPLNLPPGSGSSTSDELGGASNGTDNEDNPCELSHKLLSKMIATLKGLSQTEAGHIDVKDLITAVKTTEMKKVFACTSKLATVSLSSLQDQQNKQIAFFSNVTNLLYAHALMTFVQKKEGVVFGSLNVLQLDKIAQMAFFSRVGYYIGELGLVSLYDLHYTILRNGLSRPVLDRHHKLEMRTSMTTFDPWYDHTPSQPDPRVLYVICNGTLSSPVPRLLLPEHVHSELDTAESKYLRANVTFDLSKSLVRIPKLLNNHRNDFISRKCQYELDNPFRHLSNVALVRYIISKLPKESADQLTILADSCDPSRGRKTGELKLEVTNEDLTIGYNFPSSRRSFLGDGASPQLLRSHVPSKKPSRYKRIKPYSFTEETMSFVKQQAPLLASLVCLLCPPENISSNTQLDLTSAEDVTSDSFTSTSQDKEQADHSNRKPFIQSFHFGKSKIRQVPDLKRSHSITDESKVVLSRHSPEWQETFNKLLTLFEDGSPLKKFLVVRLECFKGILPWDRLIQELPSEEHDSKEEDPAVNLRALAVLPSNSPEIGHACSLALRKLLRRGMIEEALQFLRTEPVINNPSAVHNILDLILSTSLINDAREKQDISGRGKTTKEDESHKINPLVLVYQHSNMEVAARLVLSSLEVWPVTTCVNLLMYISYHLSSSPFVPLVNKRLQQLYVYQKIIETVETPNGMSPWRHWSDLSYDSKERKDYVLNIILEHKNYPLAREWSLVHGHGDNIVTQIEEEYIYDLLEDTEKFDPYTAQSALEDLPSQTMKQQICQQLLMRCHNLDSIMLILQFLLGRLSFQIPSQEKTKSLINQLLGVKALLSLPHFIRDQYRPLMGEPLLIIEQLLIDLKIEWAGKIIKELSEDEYISDIDTKDTPDVLGKSFSNTHNPFNSLLMFYSEKALQFPVPNTYNDISSRATSPSAPPTPFSRPLERERGWSPSETPSVPPTPRHRRGSSRGNIPGFPPPPNNESGKYSRYEPPPHPPKKEEWTSNSKYCQVCRSTYFGMFSRRHHCRRCGRVVCGPCSNHFCTVEGYEGQQRVCNQCYDYHLLLSGSSEEHLLFDQEDSNTAPPIYYGPSSQCPWRLFPQDTLFNQNLRTEFYYDESPSTPLCLAIVDLIADQKSAAGFILHCCHNVSIQLVPDHQGRVNEEIDHYFTISIMENLLRDAKLRFIRAEDSSGVELCDTYLSRVDLLRLLVSSRYTEIPTIQELTRPELARRVRDRLIADDRFKLAMEVSMKCQLETTGVWTAWGMACIKAGEFLSAREKFRHCLQGSGQSSGGGSYLLERIVEQILSSPLVSVKHSDDWSEMVKNTMALSERRHENSVVDSRRFEECYYYLKSYGTSGTMIGFLSRHQRWKEACYHIRENHCSTDIFVDHLWLPALKTGQLEQLEMCLLAIDPSLNVWEQYLTAVCRLLSQRKLFYILYHTQIFMKDYIRAAMTCIKFYIGFSGRATTIKDLYHRRKYILTAQEHFQSAIESQQSQRSGGGARMFGGRQQLEDSTRSSLSRSMSVQDLQTHIHTICLQLKITEFLYKAAVANNTLDKPVPMASSGGMDGGGQPATLFSSGTVRGEVTCHMLTSCLEFTEGFQVAYEIISAYRLPATRVFTEVAKQLATKERYVDVRLLVQCIMKSTLVSNELNDEVCMAAIKVLANQTREAKSLDKYLDKLIPMLTSNKNKIRGLIQCGKLKNAYLVAIKAGLPEEVERIADVAGKAGQLAVRDICEKWLQQHRTRR